MALFNSKKKKLFAAVAAGDLKQVKELLETTSFFQPKINIDIQEEEEGYTLLHIAVQNNHWDVVQYLVKNGAFINIETDSRETPLCLAVQNKNLNIVKFLRNNGADVNKGTPLITACEQGDLDIVQYLIEQGSDVNQGRYTSIEGTYRVLHRAAQNGHLDIVKCLVEHGADIHALATPPEEFSRPNKSDYETPLDIAKRNNQNEVVDFLTQCLQDSQKYPTIKQQNLKTQIDGLPIDKLAKLPQSDPELLQKIIVAGQLASVFERLPYEQQLPLYKASKDKMMRSDKKASENIIRSARQNQGVK